MSAVVADTVTVIWWLAGDPRLSKPAADLLQAADDGDGIHVSAVTLVDIWYATHKRTDPITTDQLAALDTVTRRYRISIGEAGPYRVDVEAVTGRAPGLTALRSGHGRAAPSRGGESEQLPTCSSAYRRLDPQGGQAMGRQ